MFQPANRPAGGTSNLSGRDVTLPGVLMTIQMPSPAWAWCGTPVHGLAAYQGWRCPICLRPLPFQTALRSVHVDHDHGSGLIRGVLCHSCNVNLGCHPGAWWGGDEGRMRAYLALPPGRRYGPTRTLRYKEGRRLHPAVASLALEHFAPPVRLVDSDVRQLAFDL